MHVDGRTAAARTGLLCAVLSMLAGVSAADGVEPPRGKAASRPGPNRPVVRRSAPGRTADEALERMASLMDASAKRLTDEFDTGSRTQDTQAQVIEAIDDAIRAAKRNKSGKSGSSKNQKGESRSAGRRSGQRSPGGSPEGSKQPPSGDSRQAGGAGGRAAGSAPSDRAEVRRGWGYLPQRDREAIVQGAEEEFLAKYRAQIERYYRAIAEKAEEGR